MNKRLALAALLLIAALTLFLLPRASDRATPIAFIYYHTDGSVSLETISEDGNQRKTLVFSRSTPDWLDTYTSWLPETRRDLLFPNRQADTMRAPIWINHLHELAYQSRKIGEYCERVRLLKWDEDQPGDIACLPANLPPGSFSWAPDGSAFAYVERGVGGSSLWILTAAGENLLRSHLHSNIWGLSWSPDSRYLAVNLVQEIGIRIYTRDGFYFNLDTPDYARDTPAWSPDSNMVAFLCLSWEIDQMDICSIDLHGDHFRRATFDISFPYIKKYLAWSPGGDRLAFAATQRQEFNDIYLVNPDGTGLLQLTNHPASDSEPNWAPDGSALVFASNRDGNWELYTIQADGGGLTRLTETAGDEREPAWGAIQGDRP